MKIFLKDYPEKNIISYEEKLKEFETVARKNNKKLKNKKHGLWIEKWFNNRNDCIREGTYKHGKKHGLWKTLSSDNCLEVYNYKYGNLHGLDRYYWQIENGGGVCTDRIWINNSDVSWNEYDKYGNLTKESPNSPVDIEYKYDENNTLIEIEANFSPHMRIYKHKLYCHAIFKLKNDRDLYLIFLINKEFSSYKKVKSFKYTTYFIKENEEILLKVEDKKTHEVIEILKSTDSKSYKISEIYVNKNGENTTRNLSNFNDAINEKDLKNGEKIIGDSKGYTNILTYTKDEYYYKD